MAWQTHTYRDKQLKELMVDHINATHKNEDYTPRYLMTEQIEGDGGDGEPALHMFETYVTLALPPHFFSINPNCVFEMRQC